MIAIPFDGMLMIEKGCWGRGGIPPALRAQIVADYQRLGARAAGRLHNRSRTTIWTIVKNSGVALKPKAERKPGAVQYQGEWFSPDHEGYLRSTSMASRRKGGHRVLQRVIWEAAHGPIPKGSMIIFTDGNPVNCALENLECKARSEWRRDPRSHSANAWTKWRRPLPALFAALDAANDAMAGPDDLPRVIAAREALERHLATSPKVPPAVAARRQAFMLAKWASYTPEQRAARVFKAMSVRWGGREG